MRSEAMASMQHAIVSSEDEQLILVDGNDEVVGHATKGGCHDGKGVLHRAFSVFLFNEAGELLLQQRGSEKRLWPGYWANSCCSHPRRGETMGQATRRRVQEELGLSSDLTFLFKFEYHASFGALGSEHELCSVFAGRCHGEATPNRTEIEATRFMSVADLDLALEQEPDLYSPWLHLEWQRIRSDYMEQIEGLWS